MTVDLHWQGPVGPGCVPESTFPDDPLIFENLCKPGVYLRIKTYDDGRIVAYAGQSVSLLARFDQHVSAMLSLSAPLRDASGNVVFTGDAVARMGSYANLAAASALAAADAGRVRFWYAMCDDYFHVEYLNLAEGLLQRRVSERLGPAFSDLENAQAAPVAMPDEFPDTWKNDFSGLDGDGRKILSGLLGEDAMTLNKLSDNAA